MNVYYDYQILYSQKYGGISRYYYDLINTIEKFHLAKTDIDCKYSANHYFDGYKGIKEGNAFLDIKAPIVRRPLRMYGHVINRAITQKKAEKSHIIHLTYYDPYALRIPSIKKIVTVYDMIEEVKRKDASLDSLIANKRECIYGADHVIAISESTKKDILRFYPDVDESKISVIYIGTSMEDVIQSKKEARSIESKFPPKYILYVGQRDGYKNFNGFIYAVKPLLEKDQDLYVLCIGGGKFKADEKEMLAGIEKRVIQFDADDNLLAVAYSNARVFVFPSFYEGFGIPTLEAFANKCPAVISNTSSMPEVGGDAVLYFDPQNEREMSDKIKCILDDDDLRIRLISRGKERIKLFSWEMIAKQTVDCYKRVIAGV